VQDVGYRAFVVEKILNSGLNGTALNTPDGRIKVLLEGDRDRILKFVEELRKEWPELAKNPVLSAPVFDESLVVPESMHSSQALLLGQFGKGVVYLKSIDGKIDALPERITNGLGSKIDALPERIAKALKGA
jgi:acylphosphatase